MTKTYPEKNKQTVAAAIAEVQEDYLWLFDEKGTLSGCLRSSLSKVGPNCVPKKNQTDPVPTMLIAD